MADFEFWLQVMIEITHPLCPARRTVGFAYPCLSRSDGHVAWNAGLCHRAGLWQKDDLGRLAALRLHHLAHDRRQYCGQHHHRQTCARQGCALEFDHLGIRGRNYCQHVLHSPCRNDRFSCRLIPCGVVSVERHAILPLAIQKHG